MAYRALYRSYRPLSFEQMVGQEHISSILKNQIQTDQLSHAYLFSGTRGTGKTTTAKILSRAVNCLRPKNGECCEECENCRISREQNGDIIEIDGASNNGVDNVRELISQAQYAPLQLKKRVFIIDEVHMLSVNAFNALLKTLEEPPAHVLFILATTEPHKLPATVISRCQRFDFKRFSAAQIMGYVKSVLERVGASVEPDALRLIAGAADGAMRDALSLADQCLTFCGNTVTAQGVSDLLGYSEQGLLFTLTEKLFQGDGEGCLLTVEELVRKGSSLSVFLGDMSRHLRALLLVQSCGSCMDLLNCTQESMDKYLKQAKLLPKEWLLYGLEKLIKARSEMKYYPDPRLLLESTLLRLSCPAVKESAEAMLSRLSALEGKIEALEGKLKDIEAKGLTVAPLPVSANAMPPAAATPAPLPSQQDAVREDLPPWEDDYIPPAPPEVYLPEAIEPPKPAPVTAPPPAPVIQPARPKPRVDSLSPKRKEAQQLWLQVLAEIREEGNSILFNIAGLCKGIAIEGDVLQLVYPRENAGRACMLNGSKNMSSLSAIVERLRPGTRLLISEERILPEEEPLKELFGNKLTVVSP